MGCRSSWTHAARSIWNSSAKPCVVMDLCYAPLIFYNNKLFISSVSLNFSWSFLQYHCACAVGLCVGPRTDFPPAPAVTAKQANVRHEYLEVMTTSEIANETEYLEELSKYNQDATRHETRVIQERLACKLIDRSTHRLDLMFDSSSKWCGLFICCLQMLSIEFRYMAARVEWLIWDNGLDGRLERLPLLREATSPKIMLYEIPSDGALDLDEIKKRRVNVFTSVGVGASSERLTQVLEMWERVQGSSSPDLRDKSAFAALLKIDNLKSRSALDLVRNKLPKKTPCAVVTLDPDQPDLLSRIRRGKRAFGCLDLTWLRFSICFSWWNDSSFFRCSCQHVLLL